MLSINNIYNEDCIIGMKKLDDNIIDLTITSPPYNCGILYDVYEDNKDWNTYLNWCSDWLQEIYRITKDDGRLCLNVLVEMGIEKNKRRVLPMMEFKNILEKIGFHLFGIPIWTDSHRVKYTAWGSWLSASSPYIYNPFEVILIAYKNVWKKKNKGISTISKEDFMMGCSGIWKLRTQTKQLTKSMFHEDLPNLCINLLSYKNDLILDPFMGSGTTAVSAIKNNRNYIGFEISNNYYNLSLKRINETIINVQDSNLKIEKKEDIECHS